MNRKDFIDKLTKFIIEEGGFLNEEINKTDEKKIKSMISSELKDFEKDIVKRIRKEIENSESEKYFTKLVADILQRFYRTMWTQRSFWYNNIKK